MSDTPAINLDHLILIDTSSAERNREPVLGASPAGQLQNQPLRLCSGFLLSEVERDGCKYEVMVRPMLGQFPLPLPDEDGNVYGVPSELLLNPKGMNIAFQQYVAGMVAEAHERGTLYKVANKVVAKARRMGLIPPDLDSSTLKASEKD